MSRPTAPLLGLVTLLAVLGLGPAQGAALKEVKIALSFPNGPAFPYYSVADEMGYAAQEGLKLTPIATAGSGAAYKALISGQVDVAHAQPAQVLNGLALGEDAVSVYTLFQGYVFQFATLDDSSYRKVADLRGTKVGVSSVAGGQYSYLLATLENAGLTVGKDVEVAEIGRGGAAGVALRDKRVSAYSASYVDMMVIELQGIKLRLIREGPAASFFSDSLAISRATLAKRPDLAIGLPRALAKATVFCMENQEACWKMIVKHVPDTAKNPEFTKALLRETLVLHQLPPEANGRWGYQRPEAWKTVHDFLVKSGQLSKPVDVSKAFTNEYVPAINQFDATKIKTDAVNYK